MEIQIDETVNHNIKIAEFMDEVHDPDFWYVPTHVQKLFGFGKVSKLKPHGLLWDLSWDWLMCVVEKVEEHHKGTIVINKPWAGFFPIYGAVPEAIITVENEDIKKAVYEVVCNLLDIK